MRVTTLASVCGLLFSAAVIAGDNHAMGSAALHGSVFPVSSAKLRARASETDNICLESSDCEECFGHLADDIRACPDSYQTEFKIRMCYSPEATGVEFGCGQPGDKGYDEKVDELREKLSDEELEAIEQDFLDGNMEGYLDKLRDADIGAASRLGREGLLISAAVGAGVLMALM